MRLQAGMSVPIDGYGQRADGLGGGRRQACRRQVVNRLSILR